MNPFRRPLLLAAVAALSSALIGCATTPAPATIADTAARTPQLSTLSKLLADAGLTDTLRGAGPFTVFAPSDEAFKAVPAKTMAELVANKVQEQHLHGLPHPGERRPGRVARHCLVPANGFLL